jgi:hypothetical protein
MPANIRDEKQKVVHFIQQVPYPDEDKKGWLEQIEQEDLTEGLFEELHAGLKALPQRNLPVIGREQIQHGSNSAYPQLAYAYRQP